MRLVLNLVTVFGTALLSQTMATAQTSVTPQSDAAVQSSTPATTSAATSQGAPVNPISGTPAVSFTPEEQSLLARGFRVVKENGHPKTEGGEKIFCRKETAIGPHIPTEQVCGTAKQLNDISNQTQRIMREGEAISMQS